jgi:hypothetical protein
VAFTTHPRFWWSIVVVYFLLFNLEGYGACMTTTSATTLTSPTMSWELFVMVVVWFFGAILFVVTSWHWERPSRPKHGRGFVGGNHSQTNVLESLNICLHSTDCTNRRDDN